jgi:hypothetical protein
MPCDIVSIQAEDDRFAVMKILAIGDDGVYGLIYARLFTERPRVVNITGLQVSYFAFTHDHFVRHLPEILVHKEVTEDKPRDYPFSATKMSDHGGRTGGEWREWLGQLAVDEKPRDSV